MKTAITAGAWAAVISLGERLADPATLAVRQQRLNRHGTELNGQLPELLLRSQDSDQSMRQWLADKDLSHWLPQLDRGTAADVWMFERASWNRSRGAAPMEPEEIACPPRQRSRCQLLRRART